MEIKTDDSTDLSTRIMLGKKPAREKIQDQVTSAWESRDLEKFRKLLNIWSENLNDVYKDFSNLRIIDILAKEIDSEEYFEELLQQPTINVDSRNHKTRQTAIHYAAEVGNSVAVELLLAKGANANIQNPNGEAALHILIQKWEPEKQHFANCLQNLLKWPDIALNIPNNQGYTPIHLAASTFEGPVHQILGSGEKLDLDTFKSSDYNETAREVLLKNFPDLENKLPGPWTPNPSSIADYQYRLFYYLQIGRGFRFSKLMREATENKLHGLLARTDGEGYTYLHRACERGLTKPVKTLIKLGVNVNNIYQEKDPPIVLAARNGHYEIFCTLLEKVNLKAEKGSKTLLHLLVQPYNVTPKSAECLRQLLSKLDTNGVNVQDNRGRTALHTAAKNSDQQSISLLLDNGAKLDIPKDTGETPLDLISEVVLRNYLDSKITSNNLPPKDKGFYLSLNYQFINDKLDHVYSLNTQLLSKVAKSHELRKLLAHPMYSTAIYLKWKRIRYFFYLNLIFYTLFCFVTTAYAFFGREVNKINGDCFILYLHEACLESISDPHCNISCFNYVFAKVFIFICIIILALTETAQMAAGFAFYIRSLENWLQWAVIISLTTLMSMDCVLTSEPSSICSELSATTILLIWLEYFFVIGDHPKLTFFIHIFRKVSLFLFRFLAVHTILIVGFTMTFHMLFRNEIGPFSTVPQAFFKTIIMLTGEFEVGEIPLKAFPVVSHIIFVVFIFLVAIVLFNLLIGFAVSATKTIEENPFLHCCISQVSIISNYEDSYCRHSFLLKKPLLLLTRCLHRKSVKSDEADSPILQVYPNQNNKMKLQFVSKRSPSDATEGIYLDLPGNLSKAIVDEMKSIIADYQRAETTKVDKIEELRQQFDGELRIIKNALLEIVEQLKSEGGQSEGRKSYRKQMKRTEMVMRQLKTPVV